MANVDDVDQALEFENEGGFLADDFDDDDLLAAAVRAEQEHVGDLDANPGVAKRPREVPPRREPRSFPNLRSEKAQKTAVEVLAEGLQELSISNGSGCITGPGMISGHPCPLVEAHAHCRFEVGGVEVLFPFSQPLEPQKAVMKSVLEALSQCKHAVLESPTGTGKTAAVLCSALAWQRHRMAKAGVAPQIMYATRTHAQVRQAMKELRRTPYRPVVAVLGSREAGLCVNPQVLQSADNDGQIRQACRQARQQKSCQFHTGLMSSDLPQLATAKLRTELWDIEDAAHFAVASNSCPYYLAHSLARHAELVFCPYSYVLDPAVRQAAGLSCADLTGRIVILDEAHNVESVCRDAGSAELTLDQLKAALSAVKRLLGEEGPVQPVLSTAPAPKKSKAVEDLGGFFVPATIAEAPVPREGKSAGKRSTGFLHAVRPLAALLQRICNFLTDVKEPVTYAPHLPEHRRVNALLRILKLDSEAMLRFPSHEGSSGPRAAQVEASVPGMPRAESLLRELVGRGLGGSFSSQLELAATLFGQLASAVRRPELYVARAHPGGQGQQAHLHLWLMSAEGTLAKLNDELHAFVLMSGTLSPLPTTIAELGPTFQSRTMAPVAANHVVGAEALRVVTVSQQSVCASSKLECTFHAWKRLPFLLSIGNALLKIVKAIPAGILIFLPSYDLLERCLEAWQKTEDDGTQLLSCDPGNRRKGRGKGRGTKRRYRGAVERVPDEVPEAMISGRSIMDDLRAAKGTIVIEPPPMCQNSTSTAARVYEAAKERYEQAILQSGQAALLAVYRGRMSEGVSFDDDFARGVVCIGIPFPNLTEERLAQKRACNDFWLARGLGNVSGDAWYESKALHAVAQALGRCIRHPRDFGALVLLDSRWSELGKASQLPQWLQPFLVDRNNADDAALLLGEHFERLGMIRPTRASEVPGGATCTDAPIEEVTKDEIKDEVKDEVKDEMKAMKDEMKEELHDTSSHHGTVTASWLETATSSSCEASSCVGSVFHVPLAQTSGVCLDLDSD